MRWGLGDWAQTHGGSLELGDGSAGTPLAGAREVGKKGQGRVGTSGGRGGARGLPPQTGGSCVTHACRSLSEPAMETVVHK